MAVVAKPRKAMGIIFLIIGVLGAILASIILPVSITETLKSFTEENNDGGAVIGAVFVALIMVIIIGFVFLDALVCIPFLVLSLVFSRKSTLKWVRIMSYVTDGLFIYVILVAIFKLIQLLVGF